VCFYVTKANSGKLEDESHRAKRAGRRVTDKIGFFDYEPASFFVMKSGVFHSFQRPFSRSHR